MIAVDTETTGFDLRHGCRPYMLTTCTEDFEVRTWEWIVDPYTRVPYIPEKSLQSARTYLDDKILVFHNPQFDVKALSLIGIDCSWDRIDDTLTASHVLDNTGSHALKDLAVRYLLDKGDDVDRLKACVEDARKLARRIGWDVCRTGHPHFPGVAFSAARNPLWYQDTWIPRVLYIEQENRNSCVDVPDEYESVARIYGEMDAVRTMRLWKVFSQAFRLNQDLYPVYLKRRATLPAIYAIEENGVPISRQRIGEKLVQYADVCSHLTHNLRTIADDPDLNPASGPQIARIVFGPDSVLKQKPDAYTERAFYPDGSRIPSTNKAAFVRIYNSYSPETADDPSTAQRFENHPAFKFARDLLCLKKFLKGASTLESYAARSVPSHRSAGLFRLHTHILLTGTDTTRTSSQDPNLQNVNKDDDRLLPQELLDHLYKKLGLSIRSVFGPEPGTCWYAADWSSMQLRLFAYVSNEQSLIDAFDVGWDPHDYMAHRIFSLPEDTKPTPGQRTIAKNTNFGFIFGATPRKIEETSGRPGLYDELRTMFPNAISFMEATIRQVRKRGFVYTPGGYRLYVRDEHAGVNYIIQGAESEIAQLALRLCCNAIESPLPYLQPSMQRMRLLMLIHDELLFEAEGEDEAIHLPAVRKLVSLMDSAGELYGGYKLPVDVDVIRHTWDCKHKVALKESER